MKSNLLVRFIIIIIVALVAGWIAATKPPQLGIDLAGGTQLVYELDLSKAPPGSQADLAAQVVQVLKDRVDPAGTKNMIWRVVEGKRIEIQMPFPGKEVKAAQDATKEATKNLSAILWHIAEVAANVDKAKDMPQDQADALLNRYLDDHVD